MASYRSGKGVPAAAHTPSSSGSSNIVSRQSAATNALIFRCCTRPLVHARVQYTACDLCCRNTETVPSSLASQHTSTHPAHGRPSALQGIGLMLHNTRSVHAVVTPSPQTAFPEVAFVLKRPAHRSSAAFVGIAATSRAAAAFEGRTHFTYAASCLCELTLSYAPCSTHAQAPVGGCQTSQHPWWRERFQAGGASRVLSAKLGGRTQGKLQGVLAHTWPRPPVRVRPRPPLQLDACRPPPRPRVMTQQVADLTVCLPHCLQHRPTGSAS